MPDGYPIQTNFTSGEISPYMFGRTDISKYFNGSAKLRNFTVKPQGGMLRRSGTRFVNEVKDSTKLTIIRRFVFSNSQKYVLEFGNLYIRIYRDGGQIQVASVPVEIVTPYLTADLQTISFSQSADVIYIAHNNYPPMTLSRTSDTSWTLSLFTTLDGPYLSVTPSVSPTVPIFLTASVITDVTIATATSAIFTATTAKNITGASSTGGFVNIHCIGHGFTTTNNIVISGIVWNTSPFSGQILFNGTWSVTVIDADHFTIPIIWPAGTGTGGTASLALSTVKYVQFRENNIWKLAQVNVFNSTTVAQVQIIDNIFSEDSQSSINYDSTYVYSSFAATFGPDDVGKFIRSTVTGGWVQITGYFSDTQMFCSAPITLIPYTYPTTLVLVNSLTRTVLIKVVSDTNVFASTDITRTIRFNYLGTQIWGTITSFTDAKNVIVTSMFSIPLDPLSQYTQPSNNGTATSWKIGAFSVTTGFPGVVNFQEQRLAFFGSIAEPQTGWLSNSGDYSNFAPTQTDSTVIDSNAITFTIASQDVNKIVWANSGPVLIVGTTGSEWMIRSSAIGSPLSPSNVTVAQQTAYGSTQLQTYRIGTSLLFIDRSGQKVRELVYNFAFDQYESHDLTVLSEHIIRLTGRAVDSCFQLNPNSQLWVVSDGGGLVSMTFLKDQEVFAWTNYDIGGNGFVESICSVPSVDQKSDTVYLVVRRTINSVTKRYIEYFESEFWPTSLTDKSTMFFVDAGLSYSGSPVNTVSGLSHLNTITPVIVADGSVRNATGPITGGNVTFDGDSATLVSVGLPFTSLYKMLPIEAGSQMGTAQGKIKRFDKLVIRILNSLGFKFGEDLTKLESVSFRSTSDLMDSSPPFFTGDKERKFTGTYDRSPSFYIQQDQPYPLSIVSIMPHVVTNSS